jgi:hypothetical protein
MYVVSEHWWPAGKSSEVGKIYLEAFQKYPDDPVVGKPVVQSAVWPVKEGMHSMSITEVEPGKIKESMDIASNRLLMLAAIDGFKYKITVAYTVVEAMPFIGLSAPQ